MRVNFGIDVSKEKLDICILIDSKKEFFQIKNSKVSINNFLNKFTDKNNEYFFGYESTSNYTIFLKEIIAKHNFYQVELNPYKISLYLKHLDTRNKDDKKDSEGIAKYVKTLEKDEFNTDFNLKKLRYKKQLSILKQLEKIHTALKNLQTSNKNIRIDFYDDEIEKLKLQIKEIRNKLIEYSSQKMYSDFKELKEVKKNISGVGDVLLLNLTPYFIDYGKYSIKQIQCHLGLTPRTFQSGSSVYKKEILSKQGSVYIRKLLYLSTISALRFNEIIKNKYNNLISKNKQKMVALIACSAHILRAIFYLYEKELNKGIKCIN